MDDPTPHLEPFSSYNPSNREFQSQIPQRINLAAAICRRHLDSITRIALSDMRFGGANTYTFGGLDYLSDKFATALSECNIKPGDAVMVALPPSAALAIAQLGSIKAGAVIVPLSPAARMDLVTHVLEVTKAKVIILNDHQLIQELERIAPEHTETCFVVGDLPINKATSRSYKNFWSEVDRCSSDFRPIESESNSPVFIFFIDKDEKAYGVVHSTRSVISQFSGFEFFNDFDDNAVFWAGDDWWSPGAVLGTLYPAWWFGCSLIADSSGEEIAITRLVDQCKITNVYSQASHWPGALSKLTNSSSEVFGTAETGWLMGSVSKGIGPGTPSVCRVVPGRLVEIIDSNGNSLPPGAVGQIAIHKSDPGLFMGYYGETKDVSTGDWFLIGELGLKTEAGELRFAREA